MYMKNNGNPWKLWAKALGEKASKCDKESDKIAMIRTFIFITYLITNCFIVAGVIRHWNKQTQIKDSYEVPGHLQQKQKEIKIQTSCDFL